MVLTRKFNNKTKVSYKLIIKCLKPATFYVPTVLSKQNINNMKYSLTLILALLVLVSCQKDTKNANLNNSPITINDLIENLEDSNNKEIMVIAHRGDWRNAPENSIQAIKSCIDMGVDMVEIDVRETKDGHLVLMHDETIDRTTNASG